jgi:hypothetical protein
LTIDYKKNRLYVYFILVEINKKELTDISQLPTP